MIRYSLRQLEYFVAVGETGSISLASEKVNVSSPSISEAIKHLEQEFGLLLFVRQHAHGLALTKAGRQLMEQARAVLCEANRLVDLADGLTESVRGALSIGCLLTFAQMIFPALRRNFEETYERVRISQFELDQSAMFNALRRAEIDIALTYNLDLPADMEFIKLFTLEPFVMVGVEHPLAKQNAIAIKDLAEHALVLLDLPYSVDYFLSFFKEAGIKPKIVEKTRDIAVMRSMVANGFGYGFANMQPKNALAPDGKPLIFLTIKNLNRPLIMGLCMPKDASKANIIRVFVDHCCALRDEGKFPGFEAPLPSARFG